MANLQVFPSANAATTMKVNGRTYTCAVGGTPIIVPDFDAFALLANGWLPSTTGGAGTTAQRPTANPATGTPAPRVGFTYFDTTLGTKIIWNGKNWINHATGAAA
jgi:hypothetical protein